MIGCRPVECGGGEICGHGRKTWEESVKNDMKLLGLQPE